MDIKQEISQSLLVVEERTDFQLTADIKKILTAAATGYSIDDLNDIYQQLYQELDKRYEKKGKRNPNLFTDLWEFYRYWKDNELTTYASRRAFIGDMYKDVSNARAKSEDDLFWSMLHPDISAMSRSRYESGHRADAVEAAFKEINSRVKAFVKQKTGKELDGADLMNHAMSPKSPVIIFDDLETEDGRNIQQGYMQLFAGSMIGIRNPHAHSNNDISPNEAKHALALASMLMNKLASATVIPEIIDDKSGKLFMRVLNPTDHELLQNIKKTLIKYPGKKEVVLVLGRDRESAIRLPHTVSVSSHALNEFKKLLGSDNVAVR